MDYISDPENKVALEFLSPSFTAAFKEYRRQRLPCILTAFILIKMNLHLDSKLRFQILRRILLRSVTVNKISLQSQTEESEVVRTGNCYFQTTTRILEVFGCNEKNLYRKVHLSKPISTLK